MREPLCHFGLVQRVEGHEKLRRRHCRPVRSVLGAAHAQGYSTPAEQRYSPYSADLPPCDDPGVLARDHRPVRTKRRRNIGIRRCRSAAIDRVRQIGFRANGLGYIPRRYCVARAQLSDLKPRAVIYAISEDARHHRLGLWRRMVRRRARQQSRLCAGMPGGAPVPRSQYRRESAARALLSGALRTA